MATDAIIPDLDPIAPPDDVEEVEEQQNRELVSDAQKLADLRHHPGYAKLEERLKQHVTAFKTGEAMAYDAKTSLADIGAKYVVSSTVANICEELLDMVTDAERVVAEDQKNREDAQRNA